MAIAGLYKIFDHWHSEGAVWLFSDPHFDDADLAHIAGRPSAEDQVRLINSKCGRKDTLVCLGDVGDLSYVKQLRAKHKVLICGNHDAGASNYQRKIFEDFYPIDTFQKEEAILESKRMYPDCQITAEQWFDFDSDTNVWRVVADNHLFDEVYTGCLMIAENIILSHEPIENLPFWCVNLHGHDHAGRKSDKRHFNFCADVIGYKPINFNQWMKEGHLSRIESIHRDTIDKATARKQKRGGKKIGEK